MSLPPAKRCVCWTAFLAMLVAVGVSIYIEQPQEPRWSVVRNGLRATPRFFSPDGAHVCLIEQAAEETAVSKRTFRIWDAKTGQALLKYPHMGNLVYFEIVSENRRFFAAQCVSGTEHGVCLVDLEPKQEHAFPCPAGMQVFTLQFTKSGQFLVAVFRTEDGQKTMVRVYDTASGKPFFTPKIKGTIEDLWIASEQLVMQTGENEDKSRIEMWNLSERKRGAVLTDVPRGVPVFAEGNLLLLIEHDRVDKWIGKGFVWNLKTGKIQSQFVSTGWTQIASAVIAPQGDWVAIRGEKDPKNCIECWNAATGKRIGEAEFGDCGLLFLTSAEGRYLTQLNPSLAFPPSMMGRMRQGPTCVMEMPSMRERWRGTDNFDVLFNRQTNRIVVVPANNEPLHVHDLATGKAQVVFDGPISNLHTPHLAGVGRHVLICQTNEGAQPAENFLQKVVAWFPWLADRMRPKYHDCTIVFDLESNRERFRLQGWNTRATLLSDDGTTLVTTHFDDGIKTIRCWDVPSQKPLRWALGIPTVLGVMLFGLSKAYTRWRKTPNAQPAQAPASQP